MLLYSSGSQSAKRLTASLNPAWAAFLAFQLAISCWFEARTAMRRSCCWLGLSWDADREVAGLPEDTINPAPAVTNTSSNR